MVKRLLELFSGTGSVGTAVKSQFDEIISIDILKKYNPTEVTDILQWDYRKYPPGHFDTIWASPPCTEYSKLKDINRYGSARKLELADSIVKRTIEIIEYYNPNRFYIENPQTGLLKERDFMVFPYYDIDYCQYSDWGYRKRTRIWTSVLNFQPKLCPGKNKCSQMIKDTGLHRVRNGPDKIGNHRPVADSKSLYKIPEALILDLFNA